MMRRDPVMLAWGLGIGLAVLAYVVGPQDLLLRLSGGFDAAMLRLGEVIGNLSLAAREVVRSLAIGIYATFVVLAILVRQRGGRSLGALFWITILFVLLIGRVGMLTESNGRWTLALLLAVFGAATMTQRMRQVTLAPRGF